MKNKCSITISVNDINIKKVSEIKYLELPITNKWTWNSGGVENGWHMNF